MTTYGYIYIYTYITTVYLSLSLYLPFVYTYMYNCRTTVHIIYIYIYINLYTHILWLTACGHGRVITHAAREHIYIYTYFPRWPEASQVHERYTRYKYKYVHSHCLGLAGSCSMWLYSTPTKHISDRPLPWYTGELCLFLMQPTAEHILHQWIHVPYKQQHSEGS